MAHTCPECGSLCYCGGDIDDCCFDDTPEQNECICCVGGPLDLDDPYYLDDDPPRLTANQQARAKARERGRLPPLPTMTEIGAKVRAKFPHIHFFY